MRADYLHIILEGMQHDTTNHIYRRIDSGIADNCSAALAQDKNDKTADDKPAAKNRSMKNRRPIHMPCPREPLRN